MLTFDIADGKLSYFLEICFQVAIKSHISGVFESMTNCSDAFYDKFILCGLYKKMFSFFVDDEQIYISKIWEHLVVWEMDTLNVLVKKANFYVVLLHFTREVYKTFSKTGF